ncbi:EamA family transporter [Mycobacteroides salmoniphilum]|uniref:EamA family transporter n=1 Tax=Mycobacteroides salmoniphilum TaxID=404941 RepID=UPI001065A73A|nr:EamA family transporter [Mycobacteroides salmoniphilum]TDZ75302.1 Threonine/homoserine exporter RhtA [Mycobacteroides salmoniphilum]TDZ83821.1 Threonine/homoserine exporter RhtA [Mycobacteroides salmoniphilum]
MTEPERHRLAAPALMLISGTSLYLGAAAGVSLFRWLDPASVAWLRICGAALVFLAIARPGRAAWQGRALCWASGFGLVTTLMNMSFYLAIDRLPLGTAVAIEFLGPISVAAIGSRSLREGFSVLAALVGVLLIADVQLSAEPAGMAFALFAALFWAGYIVLGKRVALQGNPADSLAVGFTVAMIVTAPVLAFGIAGTHGETPVGHVLVLGLLMGVLSNVIPYGLDQVILRRAGRSQFAILLALLPLSATAIGVLVMHQIPSTPELFGILAIVLAVASRRDRDPNGTPTTL